MKKILLYTIFVVAQMHSATGLFSQTQDSRDLLKEMKQLKEMYAQGMLSFDVKYLYAKQDEPKKYLDSLSGKVTISGNDYRIDLSDIETIKNDRFLIHVFKEDRLIHISKPSDQQNAMNPGGLIDSVFSNMGQLTYMIAVNSSMKVITLNFPENSVYNKIIFDIDTNTGYITRSLYVVKGEQLSGSLDDEEPGYALIEAIFSNYGKNNADPTIFSEKTFFSISGKAYLPAKQYQEYSIFLGTPNL